MLFKRILVYAILALGMTLKASAILQVDVPATYFPLGTDVASLSGTMNLFGNPTDYATTLMAGPDGFPLAYHFVFDYDETLDGGVVVNIDFSYYCNLTNTTTTQSWSPALFTVFYQLGPVFPVYAEEFSNFNIGVFQCSEAPPPPACHTEEDFDHDGVAPSGWTIQSTGGARTDPWVAVQESGSDWAMQTIQSAYDQPFEE